MGHIGLCSFENINMSDGKVRRVENKKFLENLRAYFPLVGHGPPEEARRISGDSETQIA
jgi:hypothetical protein